MDDEQMDDEQRLRAAMTASDLPMYMHDGLTAYILFGVPPGSFLRAVLSDSLRRSVMNADSTNVHLLSHYVSFLSMFAPVQSWGSEADVDRWCAAGGLFGLVTRTDGLDQ
jgi:hypothetical protein